MQCCGALGAQYLSSTLRYERFAWISTQRESLTPNSCYELCARPPGKMNLCCAMAISWPRVCEKPIRNTMGTRYPRVCNLPSPSPAQSMACNCFQSAEESHYEERWKSRYVQPD